VKASEVPHEYVLDEFRISDYQRWFTELESSAILMPIQLPVIICMLRACVSYETITIITVTFVFVVVNFVGMWCCSPTMYFFESS